MNEFIEQILRNPTVVKTADGDLTEDTAAKWAWFAHGYDTGMEPFFSAAQLREAVLSVLPTSGVKGLGVLASGNDQPKGGA